MIARFIRPHVASAVEQFPVVVLTGARQVGKTTLARWILPDATYVTLDDPARAAAARLSPDTFLAGLARPVILDEVQYAPELFRHLKMAVDREPRLGSFLVTGSQTFSLMAGVSESLAGRAAIFSLPALSLREVATGAALAETDRFLWRSGFPELWQRPELDRDLWMGSYVATYLERDVRQVLNVGDLRDFDRFLRASALRAGQLLSYADLARDVGIAPNTAKRWLSVLEASQQVFLLEPYHRQRTKRLIKAPKLYFADTGLLCHLLGFRAPADLLAHPMWGAVWENFVISEVRKRLLDTGTPPALWFWRTASGDEVDLLVETGPERFIALECKTAQQVTSDSVKGIRRAAAEYGSNAIARARIVCRTETAYPLDPSVDARAVSVRDAIDEVADIV
ncbi:MAG: hypothetical protein HW394_1619 [Acidobacteria bacterium]|nr:hypothetical protein [Acidobacteriota bacterium]